MEEESNFITFTVEEKETGEKLLIPIPKQLLLTQSKEFVKSLIQQIIDGHFKKKDNEIHN